ncbi:hypothetical protein E8E11_008842 [Didymella keratinophila]|nr:hypothetical protein E8E11_008842 [Didymella keratinophila]
MNRLTNSLHRDEEEDLIGYDESDAEAETTEITATVAIEEIDIFADDATQTEAPAQSSQLDYTTVDVEKPTDKPTGDLEEDATEETAVQPAAPPTSTTAPTTTKTTEAASVIENLNELLANADFRAALGLVKPGSELDLSFWADGLDFALSLKLVGAAAVKTCRFGAECRNKDCTFDHSGADRTAIITGKKPRKLCSKINTPAGCAKGDACWFSHEAFGVACADGDLRATCAKGPYCVYKHKDDEVIISVEQVEQPQRQVYKGGESNEAEASAPSAVPVESTAESKPESAAPAPATSATTTPKQQSRGVKRGREPNDEARGKPDKAQRVEKHQTRQEPSGRRGRGGSSAPQRDNFEIPEQSRRGSESRGRGRGGDRGGKRGGGGGRNDSYRPSEERQRGGRNQPKTEPQTKRMTRG